MRNKKNSGFTLVELIVVIAIIGILVAIAIPTMGKAINKAKLTRNKADAKIIGDALQIALYSGDIYVDYKTSGNTNTELGFRTDNKAVASNRTWMHGTGNNFAQIMKDYFPKNEHIVAEYGSDEDDKRYRFIIDADTGVCTVTLPKVDDEFGDTLYHFTIPDKCFK